MTDTTTSVSDPWAVADARSGLSRDTYPPGFSHWAPPSGGSSGGAWTTGVDQDGRRWTQEDDGTWKPEPTITPTPAGATMTAPTTTPAAATQAEVTGVRSLVAYLEQAAANHAAHAGDEGFIGSLHRMEVGAADVQLVAAAQEASRNAGQAWAQAAAAVRAHNMPVHEAYSTSPQAGNKQANTNE